MTHHAWLLCLVLAHVPAVTWANLEEATCVIHATLYMLPVEQRSTQDFGLPLDIDCSRVANISASIAAWDMSAERVAGKMHVLLDGSQTSALGVASYGLEYLDNCQQLKSVQIERFVGDATLPLNCGLENATLKRLQSLSLQYNELGTLSSITFQQLPHLQHLYLKSNSLRFMETLKGCAELQQFTCEHEEQLVLSDGSAFEQLTQLRRLQLGQLQLLRPALFEQLPANLSELFVAQTPIMERQLHITNGSQLSNVSVVYCQLLSFSLHQLEMPRLLQLNLSGNELQHFELQFGKTAAILEYLDLSENQLQTLNISWFRNLPALRELQLQNNQLHALSLAELLHLAPYSLQRLNLRENQLVSLRDTQLVAIDQAPQLRIQIDNNPWSCQWLLNFTHAQPQMFRLFQYAKYISQINVNGLTCRPQQASVAELQQPVEALPDFELPPSIDLELNARKPNVSAFTVIYGNPIELRRSQRSGAMIIVFMLPLGIALLFLLLYLYLHCERLFHLSYYLSGLPCFGDGKSAGTQCFVDRVDVVRYPMTAGNGDIVSGNAAADSKNDNDREPDGYETPLSGAASICNCTNRQSSCSRTHHVTYEALPTEQPYQVYAEIKDQDDDCGLTMYVKPSAPIYDHLAFVDEKPPKMMPSMEL